MSEPVVRYIVGVVLCAVIAAAYAATRKRGVRAIVLDSLLCFACMVGVILGVAAVVLSLCALK
ncbi:MAG: hypothetical protein ACODAJ_10805 [Planctomycetota bacterium]